MPSTNRFGSKPGADTSASTAPLPGSIATIAPPPVAERLLGHLLQIQVDGQHEVVARHRRRAAQQAYRTTACIDLDLLEAGDAMKLGFVALLEADLADMVGTAVIGLLFRSSMRFSGRGR